MKLEYVWKPWFMDIHMCGSPGHGGVDLCGDQCGREVNVVEQVESVLGK